MMVLKLSIMASRAVDSQHTFVTVPVTRMVSSPRPRRISARSEEPWMKALKRFFSTMRSAARTSRLSQSWCPLLPAVSAVLRADHVEIDRPALQRVFREGGFDPHHAAAGLAHRLREAIDVGHDL